MRPTRDQMLLGHARLASLRGTCSRLQVGAVVSRDGRILSTGYNGAPAGMTHCDHRCGCPYGKHLELNALCRANGACRISVHAEANCIAYAARWGTELQGCDLHTTDSPCLTCAQLIVNTGIYRVVYMENYRLMEGVELLKKAGLEVTKFEGLVPVGP